MKQPLLVTAVIAAATFAQPLTASADAPAATVTHYTASYSCPCFGQFTITGVHLTNKNFPGVDSGPSSTTTTGGRDNFTGTVSEPPDAELVLNNANAGPWCSDYDVARPLCTTDWSETIEPDGSLSGWAVYPNGA